MRARRISLSLLTVALLTVALTTATPAVGCSSPDSTVKPGSLAEIATLKGATFTVGSKEFTEQLVLCHMTSLALRSVGATVNEKCGLQGSSVPRAALRSGSIDMYWEYTGTAWINYLGQTDRVKDPAEQYEAVAQMDLRENHIRWGGRAPANNSYAIVVKASTARQLGVTSISDYANLTNLANLTRSNPAKAWRATTTDQRVSALGLTRLTDDKGFFPFYNPALTVRESFYKSHPDLLKIMGPIAKALTDEVLQRLNGEVDIKGEDLCIVAQKWLQEKGFIGK